MFHARPTRAKLPITRSRLRQRISQHRDLIEAGDVDLAGRIGTEHVRGAGDDPLNLMRQARTTRARGTAWPGVVRAARKEPATSAGSS